MSALQRLREAAFCRHVKAETVSKLKAEGFALVADDLHKFGITPPVELTDAAIKDMFDKVDADGRLDDGIILTYAKEELKLDLAGIGVGVEGGTIGDFFARLVAWITAHQDQILMVIKFIMMILALFGI